MNNTSLALLEFRKILGYISRYCNSPASEADVLGMLPFDSGDEIRRRQGQVSEVMKMQQQGTSLGLYPFPDLSDLLGRVRPEGAVLEPDELAGFIPVLDIAAGIAGLLGETEDAPLLTEIASALTGFPDILRLLKRSVDSEGHVLDTASPLLSDLRQQVRRLEARIQKKLEEMVRDEQMAVFLQDDFITKRSGRWVVPVRMDSKGQVAGVVHDVSKSGETAFVEPLAIINVANELENLVAEEKAEVIRILRRLSSMIRNAADGIAAEYRVVVLIDLLNAVARFAGDLDMDVPEINDGHVIRLVGARHPLLSLAKGRQETAGEVVPLDLHLGGEDTVMVITGSNAGGKTIAIKTVGLLLAMALSGLPVPADGSSSIPIVRDLLVDIGDEQSVEANLSTFSAHITRISEILGAAGGDALVLIDELGTGTDPSEGAALACAVLKELKESGALVCATTHLADIKGFVHRTPGMVNASMAFDAQTLMPLYRLRVGEPGGSHALETARRYGLPERIITLAHTMLGGMKMEFDSLIADLNEKRAEYERGIQSNERRGLELDDRAAQVDGMIREAERKQKEIVAGAYEEASQIVLVMKRKMQMLLDEARKREKERGRAAVREVVREAEAEAAVIADRLKELLPADDVLPIDSISEGNTVFARSLGLDAAVVSVNRKTGRLRVRAGGIEAELPVTEVSRPRGATKEQGHVVPPETGPDETVPSRINLVGLRVDEGLSRLEPFLNHAALAGLAEVTVIHGVGSGILGRAVREHLEDHPLVKGFRPGEKTEGGAGVTVVTLR
jgi:DNA mismatch repair protein MutS2